MKRFLALLLSLCMVFSAFPFGVLAAEDEIPEIKLGEEVRGFTTEKEHIQYTFIPEVDGVYNFELLEHSLYFFVSFIDTKGETIGENGGAGQQFTLKGGEKYILDLLAYTFGAAEGEAVPYGFHIELCDPAVSLTFNRTSVVSMEGSCVQLGVQWNDNAATEAVEWIVNPPELAEMTGTYSWTGEDYGEGGYLQLLSFGEGTVTAKSESGITTTIPLSVAPLAVIFEGETKSAELAVADGPATVFCFTPEEDGFYEVKAIDQYMCSCSVQLYCPANREKGGYAEYDGFSDSFRLEGGKAYYIDVWGSPETNSPVNVSVRHLVPATGISVSENGGLKFKEGSSGEIYASLAPENAMFEWIEFTSDNPEVLRVDWYENSGSLGIAHCSFLKEGVATITATSENGFSASALVTVEGMEQFVLDQEKEFEADWNGIRYAFVPEESGAYRFAWESSEFLEMEVFDEKGNTIYYTHDSISSGKLFLNGGERYVFSFYCWGIAQVKAKVEKGVAVQTIDLVSAPYRSEYVKGYVSEAIDLDGFKLKMTYVDGTGATWSFPDDSAGEDSVDWNVDYEAGVVTVRCGGAEYRYALALIDNPVERIEYVSGEVGSLFENVDGYEREQYDHENDSVTTYFHYNTPALNQLQVRIVYKDGTERIASADSVVDGYLIQYRDGQETEPWKLGENEAVLSYLGAELPISVSVVKNPVASIEVVEGSLSLFENMSGYWDYTWDEETQSSKEFFYYYWSVPEDVRIRVNYTDGTGETFSVKDAPNGRNFEVEAAQYETPWKKDKENALKVSYCGVTAGIPVIIRENPVASITIDKVPTAVYEYGDPRYGTMIDGSYHFYPDNLEGIELTVNMKDGSKESYTYEDFDMEKWLLDGYNFDLICEDVAQTGTFDVTFRYFNAEVDYQVELVDSPAASIEVVTPLSYTSVRGTCMPYITGLSFRVTMKDGTVKTVTSTLENTTLNSSCNYLIEDNGLVVVVRSSGDGQYVMFTAYCYDQKCTLDPISYEVDTPRAVKVENISLTDLYSGGQVKVTWKDGTSETVTLKANPVVYYDNPVETYLMYQIDDGYLAAIAFKGEEEGSYLIFFEFWNMDMPFEFTVQPAEENKGDLNGDGVVTEADAIYLLYHALFGEALYPVSGNCDYDNDGAVATSDAVYLFYHVLFGASRYPLA